MNGAERPYLKRVLDERERARQEFRAVASRGQELLEHVHQVAQTIEERVRRVLQTTYPSEASPRSDPDSLKKKTRPPRANP
jgi:hypothetical protein